MIEMVGNSGGSFDYEVPTSFADSFELSGGYQFANRLNLAAGYMAGPNHGWDQKVTIRLK